MNIYSLSYQLNQTLTNSLTLTITQSIFIYLTHSLKRQTYSLTLTLTQSLFTSITHSFTEITNSLTHTPTQSRNCIKSLIKLIINHSLIYLLKKTLAHALLKNSHQIIHWNSLTHQLPHYSNHSLTYWLTK